jgi:flagellar hook-basal body complex protein FliE
MMDPLGLLNQTASANGRCAPRPGVPAAGEPAGPSFKELIAEQIQQVNDLQQDAERAIEDLATGRRSDVEGVILASQKADTAFRMLLQVRNKVTDMYDELRQMRV